MKYIDLLVAQVQNAAGQQEYFAAYALIIMVVLLGVVVVCVPRPRQKHFIEPKNDEGEKKKEKENQEAGLIC